MLLFYSKWLIKRERGKNTNIHRKHGAPFPRRPLPTEPPSHGAPFSWLPLPKALLLMAPPTHGPPLMVPPSHGAPTHGALYSWRPLLMAPPPMAPLPNCCPRQVFFPFWAKASFHTRLCWRPSETIWHRDKESQGQTRLVN